MPAQPLVLSYFTRRGANPRSVVTLVLWIIVFGLVLLSGLLFHRCVTNEFSHDAGYYALAYQHLSHYKRFLDSDGYNFIANPVTFIHSLPPLGMTDWEILMWRERFYLKSYSARIGVVCLFGSGGMALLALGIRRASAKAQSLAYWTIVAALAFVLLLFASYTSWILYTLLNYGVPPWIELRERQLVDWFSLLMPHDYAYLLYVFVTLKILLSATWAPFLTLLLLPMLAIGLVDLLQFLRLLRQGHIATHRNFGLPMQNIPPVPQGPPLP